MAKRPLLLNTIDAMPVYLHKPEVIGLLTAEKHLMYRLMWTTGVPVSELLALTPAHFVDDGYDFGVILRTLKQGAGRPSRRSLRVRRNATSLSSIHYWRIGS